MREPTQWQPLRQPLFRALWIASIASNTGTLMHDVGAGWLMASLTPDPLMVSLVQAAASLPLFLLVLPSGVVADIVDRRVYLLLAQAWMMVAAAALGVFALAGLAGPWTLLGATVMLGIGAAMAAPPSQALLPELVGREGLADAMVLTALGGNISRTIGPVAGGLLVAYFGPAWVFLLNAASTLGMLYVVYRWRPQARTSTLPSEHFLPALRAGIRYVAAAPLLRVVVLRATLFFVFASAAWALLPLIANERLHLGATGYGALMSCLGLGAVAGSLLLPSLKRRLSADVLLRSAMYVFALALLGLAWLVTPAGVAAMLALAGFAWITSLTLLSIGAQGSSAGWVKSRALAIYLIAMFGAMAGGSMLWGLVGKAIGLANGLGIASLAMAATGVLTRRLKVDAIDALDLSPLQGMPSEAHTLALDDHHERRQVMVTVEYFVDPEDAPAFADAMRALRLARRRGGALSWSVYRDTLDVRRHLEVFVLESWLDHLRQREHLNASDLDHEARARTFHRGEGPPRVTHLLGH